MRYGQVGGVLTCHSPNLIFLGFLMYCAAVAIFSTLMIYKIAPIYGKKNPLIYISICSTVGSVSVMSVKAFGIALKLTLGGNNQFTHASTYVFIILVAVCILTQMNYFNKALSQFPTSLYVSPSAAVIELSNNPFCIGLIRYTMLHLLQQRFAHHLSSSAASTHPMPLTRYHSSADSLSSSREYTC